VVFLKNRENKINWDSCTIAGTLRNGLGQLVRLLGHSETVWDSWCNCWDTLKQFGTVGAIAGTLRNSLGQLVRLLGHLFRNYFLLRLQLFTIIFFIFALLILKPNIKRQKGCLSSEADSLFLLSRESSRQNHAKNRKRKTPNNSFTVD